MLPIRNLWPTSIWTTSGRRTIDCRSLDCRPTLDCHHHHLRHPTNESRPTPALEFDERATRRSPTTRCRCPSNERRFILIPRLAHHRALNRHSTERHCTWKHRSDQPLGIHMPYKRACNNNNTAWNPTLTGFHEQQTRNRIIREHLSNRRRRRPHHNQTSRPFSSTSPVFFAVRSL